MMGVLGGVIAALLALGHPSAAPVSDWTSAPHSAVVSMWRCDAPVRWSLAGDATPAQALAVQYAVARVEVATGQKYLQVPVGEVVAYTVTMVPEAQWAEDPSWDGATWWTSSSDATTLKDTMNPALTLAITLHELMLSRHIPEAPDPGGLLGHLVPRTAFQYSPLDNAMLAVTPCL